MLFTSPHSRTRPHAVLSNPRVVPVCVGQLFSTYCFAELLNYSLRVVSHVVTFPHNSERAQFSPQLVCDGTRKLPPLLSRQCLAPPRSYPHKSCSLASVYHDFLRPSPYFSRSRMRAVGGSEGGAAAAAGAGVGGACRREGVRRAWRAR